MFLISEFLKRAQVWLISDAQVITASSKADFDAPVLIGHFTFG